MTQRPCPASNRACRCARGMTRPSATDKCRLRHKGEAASGDPFPAWIAELAGSRERLLEKARDAVRVPPRQLRLATQCLWPRHERQPVVVLGERDRRSSCSAARSTS